MKKKTDCIEVMLEVDQCLCVFRMTT